MQYSEKEKQGMPRYRDAAKPERGRLILQCFSRSKKSISVRSQYTDDSINKICIMFSIFITIQPQKTAAQPATNAALPCCRQALGEHCIAHAANYGLISTIL